MKINFHCIKKCTKPRFIMSFKAVMLLRDKSDWIIKHNTDRQSNWAAVCFAKANIACVAVVSVSFKLSAQAQKTRKGIGQKGAKK